MISKTRLSGTVASPARPLHTGLRFYLTGWEILILRRVACRMGGLLWDDRPQ